MSSTEIKIGSKRFSLHVLQERSEHPTQPGIGSTLSGSTFEKVLYHSQAELDTLLIYSAFYHACLRWSTGENISKKFAYEFLVCLTGETQLNRLLPYTICTPENHTSEFRHYLFEFELSPIEEVNTQTSVQTVDPMDPPLHWPPTKGLRAKLAEIQLKLLSKSS